MYRRRAGLVDIIFPARPGAKSYQFSAAVNWDSVMTPFQVVPASGYKSPGVPDIGMSDSQFRGKTRFLFNPSDYTGSVPAVDDTKPFYIRITQTDWDGTVHAPEAQHLILPYDPAPNRPLVLRGTAPNGASIADSFEIQLPMQCQNPRIQVDGVNDVYAAFEPGGPEFRVPALNVEFTVVSMVLPSFSQIFLRASGGASVVCVMADIRNNPAY